MDSQFIILAGMIETAIYINNHYYKRKLKKIKKALFFKYKKTIPKIPYYRLILMELGSIKKVKYGNIREKLK